MHNACKCRDVLTACHERDQWAPEAGESTPGSRAPSTCAFPGMNDQPLRKSNGSLKSSSLGIF